MRSRLEAHMSAEDSPSQENVGKPGAETSSQSGSDLPPPEEVGAKDQRINDQDVNVPPLSTGLQSEKNNPQAPVSFQQLPQIKPDEPSELTDVAQIPVIQTPTASKKAAIEEKLVEFKKPSFSAKSSEQAAVTQKPPEPDKPLVAADVEATGKVPTADQPTITSRVNIPGAADHDPEGGGEWALLVDKVRAWYKGTDLVELIEKLKKPTLLIAGFLILLVALRVYSGILETIAKVPLAPGLLELAGILWVVWFSTTRLIRTQERQKVITGLQNTWQSFRGKVDS